MTTVKDIYEGAVRLINNFIIKEIVAQGHRLTGKMEESLDSKIFKKGKAEVMQGFAIEYTKWVNEGFPAASASFKQVPFLIEYFKKRGYEEKEAVSFAFATVKKWMKEGMPTQASKRFSSTGSRTNMIENSFVGNKDKLNEYMGNGFEFAVTERFKKLKGGKI